MYIVTIVPKFQTFICSLTNKLFVILLLDNRCTWICQNTVFSFLFQVYHDVHVTTINSIAKKYFCHYTYMYSYVAFFFCFQIYNLSD